MFGVFKGIRSESVPFFARTSVDFFLPYVVLGLVLSSSFIGSGNGLGGSGGGGVGGGGAGGATEALACEGKHISL